MLAASSIQISLKHKFVCMALLPAVLTGCVFKKASVPISATVGPATVVHGPCTKPLPAPGCGDGTCDVAGGGVIASPQGINSAECGDCVPGNTVMACGFNRCEVPRELRMTALPEYRVEPPDVLLIEAVSNLRPASSPILAGEPLLIQVDRTIPVDPGAAKVAQQFKTINGMYVIGTDGYVNLGPEYGKVLCVGQPLDEIQRRVDTHLRRILTNPQVLVTLPDPTARQQVAGPHLVRPDGTVGLGIYGSVFVAGMSLTEAKCAIEQHLSDHMHAPEVSVDVLEYRSKVYYVIADGGGAGERVYRLPSTGNDTVLSAVSQISGLPSVACKGQIWIARPSPDCHAPDQRLFVDWDAIARGAQTCTNYQLLPGDRLYIRSDPFIRFDTKLAKITAPFERLLGLALLGRTFTNFNSLNNN